MPARLAALQAAGNKALETKALPDLLVDALADDNWFNRHHALLYLDLLAEQAPLPPAAVLAITSALDDPFPDVRSTAAAVLTHVRPQARDAIPVLRKRLFDDDWTVRHNAALALWQISGDPPESVAILRMNLRSNLSGSGARDEFEGRAALAILRRIGPPAKSATPTLLLALGHKSAEVRAETAETFEAIGADDALVKLALLHACDDSSAMVQLAATAALQSIFGIVQDGRTTAVTAEDIVETINSFPDEAVLAWRGDGRFVQLISIGTVTGDVTYWNCRGAAASERTPPESNDLDAKELDSLIDDGIAKLLSTQALQDVADRAVGQLRGRTYVERHVGETSPDANP